MTVNENLGHASKCPSCGGNLFFDAEQQLLTCSFCGGTFKPEKIELLSQLVSFDQEEAASEEEDKHEIVCNSCGANIIADNNTSATFCAFCGSPSLVTKRLTKQFRPDYVIPFKLTKEEALDKIREFARNGKYAPKNFFSEKNIKKITGIYVPFWLMDTKCQMHTHSVGYKEDLKKSDKYTIVSDMVIALKNVPFDGAVNMKDDIMESIEPYDFSELVPFTGSYLQGYYAQRYDMSVDKLSDRIIYRLERYGKEAATESLKVYERFRCDMCTVKPGEIKQRYALLPVWILTYEYGGMNYQIAVNGQTGKTDGHLPVDKSKKYSRLALYHFVNIMLLSPLWGGAIAIAVWLWLWFSGNPGLFGFLAFFIFVVAIFTMPGIVFIRGTMTDLQKEELGRFNIFYPVRRAIGSLIARRRQIRKDLLELTDMMIGNKPGFDEYYDPAFKAEITHDAVFMGHQSMFEDDRKY